MCQLAVVRKAVISCSRPAVRLGTHGKGLAAADVSISGSLKRQH